MSIKIEFPISEEMTVKFSIEELKNMVEKSKHAHLPHDTIESRVVNEVYHQNHVFERVDIPSSEYQSILKRDAEDRMRANHLKDPVSIEDFIEWCWSDNAGHWPDGTPITDD